MTEDEAKLVFDELLKSANKGNPLAYVCTLLRVQGIEGIEDPFITLKSNIGLVEGALATSNDALESILDCQHFYMVLANCFRLMEDKEYCPFPFHNLDSDSRTDILSFLKEGANRNGQTELLKFIEVLEVEEPNEEQITNIISIYKGFLSAYDGYIKKHKEPKYYYLPLFEVLETVCDGERGLYGFKLHFSTGSNASFERTENSAMSINFSFGNDESGDAFLNFNVGLLDNRKNKWMIGEEDAYKVAPNFGRYNIYGEWKPLFYPVSGDENQAKARELSDDEDVQAVLFYIMCTGHWCIEFALKTSFDTSEHITFGDHIILHKSDVSQESNTSNFVIYDGTFELDSIDPEYIKDALDFLRRFLNRLSLSYDAHIDWCLKYTIIGRPTGIAKVSQDDIDVYRDLFINEIDENDAMVIEGAIDWYRRGLGMVRDNPYNAFSCYWNAMENIAINLYEGKIGGDSFSVDKEEDDVKIGRAKTMIGEMDGVDDSEVLNKVGQMYFDCVISIKNKIIASIKSVFGEESGEVDLFERLVYETTDGNHRLSFWDIRCKIAHGSISDEDKYLKEVLRLVNPQLMQFTKNMIIRLSLRLRSDEEVRHWSHSMTVGIGMNDPRATLCTNNRLQFDGYDWKIKPKWIN